MYRSIPIAVLVLWLSLVAACDQSGSTALAEGPGSGNGGPSATEVGPTSPATPTAPTTPTGKPTAEPVIAAATEVALVDLVTDPARFAGRKVRFRGYWLSFDRHDGIARVSASNTLTQVRLKVHPLAWEWNQPLFESLLLTDVWITAEGLGRAANAEAPLALVKAIQLDGAQAARRVHPTTAELNGHHYRQVRQSIDEDQDIEWARELLAGDEARSVLTSEQVTELEDAITALEHRGSRAVDAIRETIGTGSFAEARTMLEGARMLDREEYRQLEQELYEAELGARMVAEAREGNVGAARESLRIACSLIYQPAAHQRLEAALEVEIEAWRQRARSEGVRTVGLPDGTEASFDFSALAEQVYVREVTIGERADRAELEATYGRQMPAGSAWKFKLTYVWLEAPSGRIPVYGEGLYAWNSEFTWRTDKVEAHCFVSGPGARIVFSGDMR